MRLEWCTSPVSKVRRAGNGAVLLKVIVSARTPTMSALLREICGCAILIDRVLAIVAALHLG